MGLFDRFKGTKVEKQGTKASPAAKWADRVEKRAQNYDRQEAIQALSDMESPDAVEVLLKRFTFHMDPSITDQDEKDAAFRGVLRAGSAALAPVRAFAAKAESLAWPMKIVRELVDDEAFVDELLTWLSRWDTDYSKSVDAKVQILAALEEHKNAKIRGAVERFLEDVNEPVRFHAASTLLVQDDPEVLPALIELLLDEESVRVRAKVADGLAARGWTSPDADRARIRAALPHPYAIDARGHVVKA